MNNKEIIEDIKKHLTGINQVDIKYLNDQLKKYSKEKNDEVVYEIFTMIYKRLDPEALQKIHSQVESVQAKRIAEFTEAIKLYNNKEYAKSKEILLKLIDLFEKQFYMQKLNYYDFGEKIEGFIFCETPAKMDKMNIKFYPEPITRYLYYLAKIHHEENDDSRYYLAGILPHGIFELPALVIALALGVSLCSHVTDFVRHNQKGVMVPLMLQTLRVLLLRVLPLLIVAAVMEAYVTPLVLALLG